MRASGIYQILNLETGKRYIGSAKNMHGRFAAHRSHLLKGSHHSRQLQRSWIKRGVDAFKFEPLLICATKDLLFYEQRALDAFKPEYNTCKTAGSALGVVWTDESRARKSAQQRAKPNFAGRKHTPESKALIAQSKLGNTATKGKKRDPSAVAATAAAHLGMKRSPETRAKIAARAIGRKRSAESIEKGAAKRRGVRLTPEHIAKLKGNKHALGYKHTDEWKAEQSARHRGSKRPPFTAEHRARMSAALTGRKATPEARANQSAAQRGKKRGPYKRSAAC